MDYCLPGGGHGVIDTLDLKKMDYLALDDRRSHTEGTFLSRFPLQPSHVKRH